MSQLVDVLQDPENRPKIIDELTRVIDAEVAGQSGLSGMAIKTGYKVISKLKGGRMIPLAVDRLMDEFGEALQPLWDEYQGADQSRDFSAFLVANGDRASNALLGVTDQRVQEAENRVIIKTYQKLRPSAQRHVQSALPRVGEVIEKHAS